MCVDLQPGFDETFHKEEHRDSDHRGVDQKAYARIIHSAAFRRLQNKTQIFGLGESDFYRTRLTHTLEVMQIAEGIVHNLKHSVGGDKFLSNLMPSGELIQSVCLAHDIGHPPFGHGGEVALNYCMQVMAEKNPGQKRLYGFEGNGQTLRILTTLEKYHEKGGINPSRRLMLGVLKYPVAYSRAVNLESYGQKILDNFDWGFDPDKLTPPKCYLDTESKFIDWLFEPAEVNRDKDLFTSTRPKEGGHCKTVYKSLDASIMELADDISYGIHDLEDGVALGLIRKTDWGEDLINGSYSSGGRQLKLSGEILGLLNGLAADIFSGGFLRKKAIGALVHHFIVKAQLKHNSLFSYPLFAYNAALEPEESDALEILKKFVSKHLIQLPNVQLLELKGRNIITALFKAVALNPKKYITAEFYDGKLFDENDPLNLARFICDYIAGMTDVYAARLYNKIFSPGSGSIFDKL